MHLQYLDETGSACARSHSDDEAPFVGLLQRQLADAGLETTAKKLAEGTVLELADAVRLSRASLPLLGRIVQLSAGWTSGRVGEEVADAEVLPASERALPVQQLAGAAELPRPIAQPLSDWDAFCRALLDLRCQVDEGKAVAWHPKVDVKPDEDGACDGSFTGVDVLRAVALARLLLPPSVPVVAPLATLGPKLAQVALDFGATHVGYVAHEGQEVESPLIASGSLLDELRGSCSPTMLGGE